jgi:Ethanolamine utilization protein EutJ (predicted chaperonin)
VVVIAKDETSTTTYVADTSSGKTEIKVIEPAAPVYEEVNKKDFKEATTEQDVVANVKPVVNKDGDIIAFDVNGNV